MKILIVDDNADNIFLLESLLKSNNYQLLIAHNGKQALETLTREIVDLIIADILMPVMDGFQLCRKVKQNETWSRIPFVFYTATYTDEMDEELALQEGADRFLRKPMEPEAFMEAIHNVVKEAEEQKIIGKKPGPSLGEETLELYSTRLVQKLEKKMVDLEQEIEVRRRAEKALRISEERYRVLFNAGNDAMFVFYLPGKGKRAKFIEVNDLACERLGYSREEFLKLTPEDLLAPESIKPAREAMKKLIIQKKIIFEAVRLTKDGKKIPVEISSTIFAMNGKEMVLSISRDITERKEVQKALQKSEKEYRQIVETTNEGIWTIDANNKTSFVNDTMAKLLGYTPEEMMNKSLFELMASEDIKIAEKNVHWRKDGKAEQHEFKFTRKDGTSVWTLLNTTPMFSKSGEYGGALAMVTDITERKQAEQKLRDSEERYRVLFNAGSDAIFVHHPTEDKNPGKFIEVNEVACKMLGYSNEELLQKTLQDIVDLEKTQIMAIMRRIFDEKQVIFESVHVTKTGKKIPVEINAHFFEFKGKPSILSISRDISQRRQIEQEIRMLAHAIRSISECVSVTDMQDRFLFVNNAFLKTYGYTQEEIMHMSLSDLRSPKTPKEIQEKILPVTLKGGWHGELWNIRKNAEEFPINLSTSIIRDENQKPIALIGIASDISERKQLEQQLLQSQTLDALGQLAGGIAHDFNNLLTVINGTAELAMMDLEPDQAIHHDLSEILNAGKSAGGLVRQLLAFSRKQLIEPEILDLNYLITNLQKMIRRLIGEDIGIEWKLAKKIARVFADPGQMEQILINLIVNARDAINAKPSIAAEKKITIQTENIFLDETFTALHLESKRGQHVVLTISDSGIGMDQSTKDHLFEPFFTTKGKGKGTGLGLSTVYGIVKQNDGNIYVYSEPGVGATFRIFWPAYSSEFPLESIDEEKEMAAGGTETILLVEDEPSVRKFAARALQSRGYTVIEADNGADALQKIKNIQIDLLVTDVVMPEMGGKELADQMNKIIPEAKVLFVSGYTDNQIVHSGVLLAGIQIIQKPYSIEALAKKVRDILDKK